jgi:hypothetical protein
LPVEPTIADVSFANETSAFALRETFVAAPFFAVDQATTPYGFEAGRSHCVSIFASSPPSNLMKLKPLLAKDLLLAARED